jgi:hypothetical protein
MIPCQDEGTVKIPPPPPKLYCETAHSFALCACLSVVKYPSLIPVDAPRNKSTNHSTNIDITR